MVRVFLRRRRLALAVLPFVAACGAKTRTVEVVPSPASVALEAMQLAPVPATDPVLALIDSSNAHFLAGQREVEQGHFDAAKVEFDRAVNVLLESPYGARREPRIREHFDRIVDRISAYEVKALAEGDGFNEKGSEAASIDQLLAETSTFGPPPAPPELTDTVRSDLESIVHDVPIPLNDRVLAYIELFQGRLHDFIEEGMKRGGKYLPMIQSVFRAEGLPLDLAYVPLVESAFKPNALSRAKARGVWQFMAGTGTENGLRRDWFIDERSDPEKATQAAAKYLLSLAQMFEGDWHLALASYNGGPGRVQRALKRGRVDDFWKLAAKPRMLPRETREYVPMILAAIVIARNPTQYGFDFEAEPALAYETVMLSRPVDLRRVAEWADTTIDEIQELNPELRRWTTPVRESQYELKVPAGKGEQVTARLADAPDAELASLNWYTARRGDTLATIAKKLKVSRSDLAEANYLSTRARVSVGQQLMVPREATVLMAAGGATPLSPTVTVTESATVEAVSTSPGRTSEVALASRTTSVEAQTPSGEPARERVIYSVKRGDTLAKIARLFQTTVAAIRSWNNIPGDRIAAGQRLTVYRIVS
jgi:membrane-bound lytic murein transglycosylase D